MAFNRHPTNATPHIMMTNPTPPLIDVAVHYATNRGFDIFPVNPRTKAPLTKHGMKDATRDTTQIREWWQQHPDALIGCRIPTDLIVLDIDPRHGGLATWEALQNEYATIMARRIHISGRGDGGAHYWFQHPGKKLTDRPLRDWAQQHNVGHPITDRDGNPTGKWASGIDILTHWHRYTILPPSPHPETGQPYNWQIRDTPDPLPNFLTELLTEPDTPAPTPQPAPVAHTNDSPADHYNNTTRWNDILTPHGWQLVHGDGNTDGSKWRHPTATAEHSATITHGCLFIYSPNTGFEETTPGDPHGYTKFRANAILNHHGNLSEAARHIKTNTHTPTTSHTPTHNPTTPTTPHNLPDTFWNTTPQLQHIRQAAHARLRSADAVLAATLARIAAQITPTLTLPPIVGSPASLNTLIGIIASSGGGKSSSVAVARELVPINRKDVVADIPPGSGEGLIELYFEYVPEEQADGKIRKVKRQTKTGALIYLDEGQALAEMGARKGATLMPTLRSAWSGSVIGQSNATQETHRVLKDHTYRMAIIIGFQKEYAATLIADAAGGTPQRFLFATATDPHIPDTPPEWPGQLTINTPPAIPGQHLTINPDITTEIRQRALAITRGQYTPHELDSHADLVKLKTAALIAILHHTTHIDLQHWELAGHIMQTSNAVRDDIINTAAHQQAASEHAYAQRLAKRGIIAEETQEQRALISGARSIARKVGAANQPVTRRDITQSVSGRVRKLVSIDDIINYATEQNWIVDGGEQGYTPGESAPR